MNINIFSKYWNILKRNYQDKTHNEEDMKIYYSIFKECDVDDFINAIKQVLKYQSYFPRIDEIYKYLPIEENEEEPSWFKKEKIEVEKTTTHEQEELENILKEIGG